MNKLLGWWLVAGGWWLVLGVVGLAVSGAIANVVKLADADAIRHPRWRWHR
jgi:hypothetical protein